MRLYAVAVVDEKNEKKNRFHVTAGRACGENPRRSIKLQFDAKIQKKINGMTAIVSKCNWQTAICSERDRDIFIDRWLVSEMNGCGVRTHYYYLLVNLLLFKWLRCSMTIFTKKKKQTKTILWYFNGMTMFSSIKKRHQRTQRKHKECAKHSTMCTKIRQSVICPPVRVFWHFVNYQVTHRIDHLNSGHTHTHKRHNIQFLARNHNAAAAAFTSQNSICICIYFSLQTKEITA